MPLRHPVDRARPIITCAVLIALALLAPPLRGDDGTPTAVAEDPPSAVATALAAGEQALRRHDGAGLMAASRQLALGEAHAAAGDDLIAVWAQQALAWGARSGPIPLRRGRLLGPGYRQVVLAPGARYQTRQVFAAGQAARVELLALDPGSFRLAVVSDGGAPVCQRAARAGTIACHWVPLYSSQHEIRVENSAATPARFYLVTF